MIFVGYTTLGSLLNELTVEDLIYLSLTTSTHHSSLPRAECTLVLSSPVKQNGMEMVRYVALKIGEWVALDDRRTKLVRRRGAETLNQVQALLTARCLRWRDALATMPKGQMLLHGDADPLRYDKQADCWLLPAIAA